MNVRLGRCDGRYTLDVAVKVSHCKYANIYSSFIVWHFICTLIRLTGRIARILP